MAKINPETNPTTETYLDFDKAYAFFNRRLFAGTLPACLITLQRRKSTYGYFSPERWEATQRPEIADEIALNPDHFRERTTAQVLSTLVHEMAHLWQHHFGKPSRGGYHNKEWAARMDELGLTPSDTGAPGGKRTGPRVSHYIAPDGPFAREAAALTAKKFAVPYIDRFGEDRATAKKKKAASKTKYTCAGCGVNAWAKPDTYLVCGDCETAMEAAVR